MKLAYRRIRDKSRNIEFNIVSNCRTTIFKFLTEILKICLEDFVLLTPAKVSYNAAATALNLRGDHSPSSRTQQTTPAKLVLSWFVHFKSNPSN